MFKTIASVACIEGQYKLPLIVEGLQALLTG